MKYRYLPPAIMLIAGAITCGICIYNGYETLYSLKMLLVVLLIFWFIGGLTKRALIYIMALGNNMAAGNTDKEKNDINKEQTEANEGDTVDEDRASEEESEDGEE